METKINHFIFSVEHFIADGSAIHFVLTCLKGKEPIIELVKHNVPYLIERFDHVSVLMAICINFINIISTFVWNFLDIFIMSISIGLATHFELLNNELKKATFEVNHLNRVQSSKFYVNIINFQNVPNDFWMNMREQYAKLCNLVAIVDKRISHMVLLSFFNNLFFICRQLFESLR